MSDADISPNEGTDPFAASLELYTRAYSRRWALGVGGALMMSGALNKPDRLAMLEPIGLGVGMILSGLIGARWPHSLFFLIDGLLFGAGTCFLAFVAARGIGFDERGPGMQWGIVAFSACITVWFLLIYRKVFRARGSPLGAGVAVLWGVSAPVAFWFIVTASSSDYPQIIKRGNAQRERKDYPAALAAYNEAIQLDPSRPTAWFNRGLVRMDTGQERDAIDDFTRAIERKPDMFDAYINRGRCRHKLKDSDGAFDDFTRVIELDPNEAVAYGLRSRIWQERGRKDLAQHDMEMFQKRYKPTTAGEPRSTQP